MTTNLKKSNLRKEVEGDEKQKKKIKTSWDMKSLKNRKVDGHGQWIVY